MTSPTAAPAAPTPTTTFESLLTSVRSRVDERLATFLAPRVASAAQISAEVGAAAKAASDLTLRGGKRMRAALVAVGFEACSASPSTATTSRSRSRSWSVCEEAMMAVELLQTYLLIHDDWMDSDDTRRGGPAVHILLRDWFGSPHLANAGAVLAGDLASGYAQEALLETKTTADTNANGVGVTADCILRAARSFARIQVEVVTGQLAEMRGNPSKNGNDSSSAALPSVETIHALKTASYTVTGPLLLGAALAGADDARCAGLERFGRPLGIAFQLRDDLLGTFGDPSATGKPVWNDVKQGKRTALMAELRGNTKADALVARLSAPDANDADVAAVVRMMEESGAKSRVEARARELCAEAQRALDAMAAASHQPPMSITGHAWLTGAITALGERSS